MNNDIIPLKEAYNEYYFNSHLFHPNNRTIEMTMHYNGVNNRTV